MTKSGRAVSGNEKKIDLTKENAAKMVIEFAVPWAVCYRLSK